MIDGTGNAWFHGDVALKGGRIARIAPAGMLDRRRRERADRRERAGRLPGIHRHPEPFARALLTGDGRVVSKVTQGVTTEIMGEGWSNAPANDRTIAFIKSDEPDAAKMRRRVHGPARVRRLAAGDEEPRLVGQFRLVRRIGNRPGLRQGDGPGLAHDAELETMRGLVVDAMEDGAFGLASALIYPPDNFVATRT